MQIIGDPIKELVIELLIFVFGVVSLSLLWHSPIITSLLIILLALGILKFWYEKNDWLWFVAAGFFGALGEILIIRFGGVWHYANPDFLGVPMYLPLAYGISGLMGKKIIFTLVRLIERFRKKV